MKTGNLIKAVCLFVFVALTSCETERVIFDGPNFVRFNQESQILRESYSDVIDIPVHIAGPVPENDLAIRYSVSGTAREGVDFIIVGDQRMVVIPKGKYFGQIQVQLINNANNILRQQDIVFTLESTNDGRVGAGQRRSGIGKTFTLTILDDCILGGNYQGVQSGFSIPKEGIRITSEDCETYTLSDWNVGVFNTPFELDMIFIDNADNTLTIPEQEEDILPPDLATIKGIGTVDPVTRIITFTVVLVDFDEEPEVTFTLIPD